MVRLGVEQERVLQVDTTHHGSSQKVTSTSSLPFTQPISTTPKASCAPSCTKACGHKSKVRHKGLLARGVGRGERIRVRWIQPTTRCC